MPILRITALPQRPDIDVTAAMQRTCLALADTMGLPSDQVWGTWTPLSPSAYAVGDIVPDVQPHSTHPPLVDLMALEGRSADLRAQMLECVGSVLSAELGLQVGNVYVRYVEMQKTMVYSGGKVLALD